MRILVSAYACEPHVGSEPGVGWNWVTHIAKTYKEVHVVTRTGDRYRDKDGRLNVRDSKSNLEAELARMKNTDHIHFHYYDLPTWISNLERSLMGDMINIYLWEVMAFFFMLKRFRKGEFDWVQKVTIVSHRFPGFAWFFGKKYIHGPIAGGERYPLRLLKLFSFKGRLKELMRFFFQGTPFFDPLVWLTYAKSHQIIAVTNETRSIIPSAFRHKCIVQQAVSADGFIGAPALPERNRTEGESLKLLFVGRMLEWKGIMLTLKSLVHLKGKIPFEMNMIGAGADQPMFEAFVKEHDLPVRFLGFIPQKDLPDYYESHDLFMFPSLRDSGGFVVLEAQASGLPVLTLDLGGPFLNVDPTTGVVIEVENKSVESLTQTIADRVHDFYLRLNSKGNRMMAKNRSIQ